MEGKGSTYTAIGPASEHELVSKAQMLVARRAEGREGALCEVREECHELNEKVVRIVGSGDRVVHMGAVREADTDGLRAP